MRNKFFYLMKVLLALVMAVSMVLPESSGQAMSQKAAPQAQDASAGLPTDRVIIKYADGSSAQSEPSASALMDTLSATAGVPLQYARAMSGDAHVLQLGESLPLDQVEAISASLSALPGVEYAEPDRIKLPTLEPNDPGYYDGIAENGSSGSMFQWDLWSTYGINAPAAWDITQGDSSVVVAVIDTGITDHPEFTGRVVDGYDFITDPGNANDGDGRDATPSDPGDNYGGYANSWHGTHVAGTIAANSNNGVGVAGIDWYARILPVRVLGRYGGYTSDIVDGMRWAAGLTVAGAPTNVTPAKVLNLSLGGPGACSATEQAAINEVTEVGVGKPGAVVVVAAGNENMDVTSTNIYNGSAPANCNGVIAVAATDYVGDRSSYSNYGSLVKISAPGDYIVSTSNDGQFVLGGSSYEEKFGTSMAAPHVSGVVSLMFAANPNLTPPQALEILKKTATAFPGGSTCTTSLCGAGIVNAGAAVTSARQPDLVITNVSLSDPYPDLGEQFQLNVTVKNQGGADTISNINLQVFVDEDPVVLYPDRGSAYAGCLEMADSSCDTGDFVLSNGLGVPSGLPAGASVTVPVIINNPGSADYQDPNPWTETSPVDWDDGTHNLYVYVDGNGIHEESVETNNHYASNPVVLNPYIEGALVSPLQEKIGEYSPMFKWNKVQDAARYNVVVYKQGLVKNKKTGKWVLTNIYMLNQWFTQDQACDTGTHFCSVSAGPATPFASGTYYWQLQYVTTGGVSSPWSELITFTVELPGVTLFTPVNGAIGYIVEGDLATSTIPDYKPTFSWSKDSQATDYYVYVPGPSVYNKIKRKWYPTALVSQWVKAAACDAETEVCTLESPVSFGAGTYTWSVTPYSPGGSGLAVSGTFNTGLTPPGAVARLSPTNAASGYIETGGKPEYAPKFEWTADPIATQYYVYVAGPPVWNSRLRKLITTPVVSQWVSSDACDPDTDECSLQGPTLSATNYTWYVQAYNPAGIGPLPADPYGYFNTSTTAPGVVTRGLPVDDPAGYLIKTDGKSEYAPEFTWSVDPIATQYYVYVSGPPIWNSKTKKWIPNTVVSQWVKPDACDASTCSLQGPELRGGAYSWFVQAYNPAGYGPLPAVTHGSFHIDTTLPDAVDLTYPIGGTNGDYTPVFTWSQSSMATKYYVYVAGPPLYNSKTRKWIPNPVFTQWVTSEDADCDSGTCSLQGPTLAAMDYSWYVAPYNPAGAGPVLEYGTFNPITAVPNAVSLLGPENDITLGYILKTGVIPEYAPKYEWTAVDTATKYYVYVAGPPVYNSKTRKWYTYPAVSQWVMPDACDGGTGICSLQGPTLSATTYNWSVQAYNLSGGSIPTSGTFNTSTTTPPDAVTDMQRPFPVGDEVVNIGTDYNPTFEWGRVDGATQYLLYVAGPPVYNSKLRRWVTIPVLNNWFPADTICSDTVCAVQSPTLGGYTYYWQVLASNPAGSTGWSQAVAFSPDVQTLPAPVSGMMVNSLPNDNLKEQPVLSWKKVDMATSYRVYVSGTNGVVLDQWVRSVDKCVDTDIDGNAICTVEFPTTLAPASYTWWVQTYNLVGYGTWRKSTFSVVAAPDAVENLQPLGPTSDTQPEFSWNIANNATQYHFYIRRKDNGAIMADEWLKSTDICDLGTCTLPSPVTLTAGYTYTWSVMPYKDQSGYGPWTNSDLDIQ